MKCKHCWKEIPYNPYINTWYCCKECEDKDKQNNWWDIIDFFNNNIFNK